MTARRSPQTFAKVQFFGGVPKGLAPGAPARTVCSARSRVRLAMASSRPWMALARSSSWTPPARGTSFGSSPLAVSADGGADRRHQPPPRRLDWQPTSQPGQALLGHVASAARSARPRPWLSHGVARPRPLALSRCRCRRHHERGFAPLCVGLPGLVTSGQDLRLVPLGDPPVADVGVDPTRRTRPEFGTRGRSRASVNRRASLLWWASLSATRSPNPLPPSPPPTGLGDPHEHGLGPGLAAWAARRSRAKVPARLASSTIKRSPAASCRRPNSASDRRPARSPRGRAAVPRTAGPDRKSGRQVLLPLLRCEGRLQEPAPQIEAACTSRAGASPRGA